MTICIPQIIINKRLPYSTLSFYKNKCTEKKPQQKNAIDDHLLIDFIIYIRVLKGKRFY